MKINEIVINNNVDTSNWLSDTQKEHLKKYGKELGILHSKFQIIGVREGNELTVGVFQEDNLICICFLEKYTNYWQTHGIKRDQSNDDSKGIPAELISFLHKDMNFKIISDSVMTSQGVNFWKKLEQNREDMDIYAYDLKTNQKYKMPLSVSDKIISGDDETYVMHPTEEDSGDKLFDIGIEGKKKLRSEPRWVWLIETYYYKNKTHDWKEWNDGKSEGQILKERAEKGLGFWPQKRPYKFKDFNTHPDWY